MLCFNDRVSHEVLSLPLRRWQENRPPKAPTLGEGLKSNCVSV